jgi:hypothetical protein
MLLEGARPDPVRGRCGLGPQQLDRVASEEDAHIMPFRGRGSRDQHRQRRPGRILRAGSEVDE